MCQEKYQHLNPLKGTNYRHEIEILLKFRGIVILLVSFGISHDGFACMSLALSPPLLPQEVPHPPCWIDPSLTCAVLRGFLLLGVGVG
jgi:hypothetical protein